MHKITHGVAMSCITCFMGRAPKVSYEISNEVLVIFCTHKKKKISCLV